MGFLIGKCTVKKNFGENNLEFESKILEAKSKSIKEIAFRSGCNPIQKGNLFIMKSPVSVDKTHSLVIYPKNDFYDFAAGLGGDAIKFYMHVFGVEFNVAVNELCERIVSKVTITEAKSKEEPPFFDISKYLTSSRESISKISQYANSRAIWRNYVHANMFQDRISPAMGFVHTNYYGTVCGIQMRNIADSKLRYNSAGKVKYYIIDGITGKDPTIYFSESETSSNSLAEFLFDNNQNFVVISGGSWGNVPLRFPAKYEHIEKRKLIIDFDGSKELYNERLKKFSHLKLKDICLPLKKGDDINSLYCSGEIKYYKKLIING